MKQETCFESIQQQTFDKKIVVGERLCVLVLRLPLPTAPPIPWISLKQWNWFVFIDILQG